MALCRIHKRSQKSVFRLGQHARIAWGYKPCRRIVCEVGYSQWLLADAVLRLGGGSPTPSLAILAKLLRRGAQVACKKSSCIGEVRSRPLSFLVPLRTLTYVTIGTSTTSDVAPTLLMCCLGIHGPPPGTTTTTTTHSPIITGLSCTGTDFRLRRHLPPLGLDN